jgi:hypothetical protein
MLLIAPTFDRYAPAEDVRLEAAPKSLLSVCRGERVFSAGVRVSGNSTIVSSLCGQLRQRMFRTCSQYASVGDLRSPMIAWATSSWQFIHPVSSSVSSSCTILTWYSLPCSCVFSQSVLRVVTGCGGFFSTVGRWFGKLVPPSAAFGPPHSTQR